MYKNRYGDEVEMIELSENRIWFKVTTAEGNPSEYWRFGWKDEQAGTGEYNMADPSGGPYIAEGHDLGWEEPSLKGKKVKYITNEDGKVIIHV